MATVKRRECVYFYDEEMTNYNYGGGNPMRPHRVKLTTQLLNGYGLTDQMQILRPVERTREEIMLFHADGTPGGVGERVSHSSSHAEQHDMEPT